MTTTERQYGTRHGLTHEQNAYIDQVVHAHNRSLLWARLAQQIAVAHDQTRLGRHDAATSRNSAQLTRLAAQLRHIANQAEQAANT